MPIDLMFAGFKRSRHQKIAIQIIASHSADGREPPTAILGVTPTTRIKSL
jgi:hypothetical protein